METQQLDHVEKVKHIYTNQHYNSILVKKQTVNA